MVQHFYPCVPVTYIPMLRYRPSNVFLLRTDSAAYAYTIKESSAFTTLAVIKYSSLRLTGRLPLHVVVPPRPGLPKLRYISSTRERAP